MTVLRKGGKLEEASGDQESTIGLCEVLIWNVNKDVATPILQTQVLSISVSPKPFPIKGLAQLHVPRAKSCVCRKAAKVIAHSRRSILQCLPARSMPSLTTLSVSSVALDSARQWYHPNVLVLPLSGKLVNRHKCRDVFSHLDEVAVVCSAPLEAILYINLQTFVADPTQCCDCFGQTDSLIPLYLDLCRLWRSLQADHPQLKP